MALTDTMNYRRFIPSTGGVGLREDANRSSSSADGDGDLKDAMDKEDSRCICSKTEKGISTDRQDHNTTDAIIQSLQRTSSNSNSSLQMSSKQQHRQEEDTSCSANSITTTFSFSLPSPKEIIADKAKYKHSNSSPSSGSSPMTAVTKTSLTAASSSTTSSGSSNVGSRHNDSYPDEILARNTIITFEKKSNKDVKCPSIPFFDYLEEQVSKLIEKNESAPKCYVATILPRRNSITHHPELSPISSQSVAVAEAKNIRRLRREVLGLYRTLDTLKKDSREWMLLKSKLDAAREELDAVLEDQQLVRSIETVKTW